ncbi:MAG: VOC family virulence protein [Deinococcus sp.]|nr:VOC family virulence protein [Deinococcus sp.]
MLKLDHMVIHVIDWERSNRFYADVLGAEVVPHASGSVYRIGRQQLNVHGPGLEVQEVARLPVQPGNSDLCFEWAGSVAEAQAYLAARGAEVVSGPVRRPGAKGEGRSLYFRDLDGSLLEFISYQEEK